MCPASIATLNKILHKHRHTWRGYLEIIHSYLDFHIYYLPVKVVIRFPFVCVWFNIRCLDAKVPRIYFFDVILFDSSLNRELRISKDAAGVWQVVYQIVGPILVISVQVGRLYLLRCLLVQRHKSMHV